MHIKRQRHIDSLIHSLHFYFLTLNSLFSSSSSPSSLAIQFQASYNQAQAVATGTQLQLMQLRKEFEDHKQNTGLESDSKLAELVRERTKTEQALGEAKRDLAAVQQELSALQGDMVGVKAVENSLRIELDQVASARAELQERVAAQETQVSVLSCHFFKFKKWITLRKTPLTNCRDPRSNAMKWTIKHFSVRLTPSSQSAMRCRHR